MTSPWRQNSPDTRHRSQKNRSFGCGFFCSGRGAPVPKNRAWRLLGLAAQPTGLGSPTPATAGPNVGHDCRLALSKAKPNASHGGAGCWASCVSANLRAGSGLGWCCAASGGRYRVIGQPKPGVSGSSANSAGSAVWTVSQTSSTLMSKYP